MPLLDTICVWAQTLPDWQGDAVRRILTQDEVGEKDKKELLGMLKAKHDLTVEDPVQPLPLKKGDVSGVPSQAAKITLRAITDLQNVNMIPDSSEIPFNETGITVVYGENGTGKSGYARVLKRACRARDTTEQILPNVFSAAQKEPAKACFVISVDGKEQPVVWTDGQQADDILTNICVFDSKCARLIIDDKNELFYLPYGADVFSGLARIITQIRELLQGECPTFERLEYPDIAPGTKAADFISNLSKETTDEQIAEITSWSEKDDIQLQKLSSNIAKAEADDPLQQAKRLRNGKSAVTALREKIVNLHSIVSDEKEVEIIKGVQRLKTAIEACALAKVIDFSHEPLPGVGTDAWKSLYEAAREYSTTIAYKGDDCFPSAKMAQVREFG